MGIKKLLLLLLLTGAAAAHPVADRAAAVEGTARLLAERLQGAQGWGEQVARDDLARLTTAAGALRQALQGEDWEAARPQLSEFQVAGNRVRMSLGISHLDAEGMKLGEGVVTQVQEVEQMATEERRRQDDLALARSRPSFGIGLSAYSGYPWGGFYPYGFGGYRGFRAAPFRGGVFHGGGRCR